MDPGLGLCGQKLVAVVGWAGRKGGRDPQGAAAPESVTAVGTVPSEVWWPSRGRAKYRGLKLRRHRSWSKTQMLRPEPPEYPGDLAGIR